MNHVTTITQNISFNDFSTEVRGSGNMSCFEIRIIEWLLVNQRKQLCAPNACSRFMILWIRKGTLVHCVDRRHYVMQDGLYGLALGAYQQNDRYVETNPYVGRKSDKRTAVR
jgi:hypothetical protein